MRTFPGRMAYVTSVPQTKISIWRADAVVLFDWLMTVDLNAVPITHPAEKQALADLLTRLEESDVAGVDQNDIDTSREAVARDMGWQVSARRHRKTFCVSLQDEGTSS
jgi:hypothetical protein